MEAKISKVIESVFGRNGLPISIRFVSDNSEYNAKAGWIYTFDHGFWVGPGEYVLMAHLVKKLIIQRKVVWNVHTNSGGRNVGDGNSFVSVRNNRVGSWSQ